MAGKAHALRLYVRACLAMDTPFAAWMVAQHSLRACLSSRRQRRSEAKQVVWQRETSMTGRVRVELAA